MRESGVNGGLGIEIASTDGAFVQLAMSTILLSHTHTHGLLAMQWAAAATTLGKPCASAAAHN